MAIPNHSRDDELAKTNADGQWASNFAWGFAVLMALTAVLLWAMFGR